MQWPQLLSQVKTCHENFVRNYYNITADFRKNSEAQGFCFYYAWSIEYFK